MSSKAIKRLKQRPKLGDVFMLEGQRYEIQALTPYERTDGTTSNLITWQSHCADCGQSFETKTAMVIYGINRRCEKHRSPGKPVVNKIKRSYRRLKKHDA